MHDRGYHLLPPWPRWPVAAVVAGILQLHKKTEGKTRQKKENSPVWPKTDDVGLFSDTHGCETTGKMWVTAVADRS